MTVQTYRLPPRFFGDHQSRDLPEDETAISRLVGTTRGNHRLEVELDELGYDELLADATYYATEMRSAGYSDQGVISSARATRRALEQQGRPS